MKVVDPVPTWKANRRPTLPEHQIVLGLTLPYVGKCTGYVSWNNHRQAYEFKFAKIVGTDFYIQELVIEEYAGKIIKKYIRRIIGVKHFPNLHYMEKREKLNELLAITSL